MHAVSIQSEDREQLLADFAEALRTGSVPEKPFLVVLSYKMPAEQVAAVCAFVEGLL